MQVRGDQGGHDAKSPLLHLNPKPRMPTEHHSPTMNRQTIKGHSLDPVADAVIAAKTENPDLHDELNH
jgi:hypothetical protein